MLAAVIPKWIAGEIRPVPQDESRATYTRKFTKEDGLIDLSGDACPSEAERRRRAYKNFLKIRALEGGIGTYFYYTTPSPRLTAGYSPLIKGEMEPRRIRVKITDASYKDGVLEILRVLPEGKREMSYEEFLRGQK